MAASLGEGRNSADGNVTTNISEGGLAAQPELSRKTVSYIFNSRPYAHGGGCSGAALLRGCFDKGTGGVWRFTVTDAGT